VYDRLAMQASFSANRAADILQSRVNGMTVSINANVSHRQTRGRQEQVQTRQIAMIDIARTVNRRKRVDPFARRPEAGK